MITGMHLLLYSRNVEADRAFLRDVLQFRTVDAGHGWLIFALPPTELAIHPDSGDRVQASTDPAMAGAELYLMCDDLNATIGDLRARGVVFSDPEQARWGIKTALTLPSGTKIGLYLPAHVTAIGA